MKSTKIAIATLLASIFKKLLAARKQVVSSVAIAVLPHIRARFILDTECLTTFDENIKIYCRLDDHIESQIFWQGMQEGDIGVYLILKELLEEGDVFIDVGACIGTFTLVAANRVGDSGIVYAIEPVRKHFSRLKRNIELNGFSNVKILGVALSNKKEKGKIYVPNTKNTGMASLEVQLMSAEYGTEVTEIKRLDDLVIEEGITKMDVIKIDVEGCELNVLYGAINSIERFRPHIILEVNREFLTKRDVSPEEYIDFFKSRQYRVYRIVHEVWNCWLVPVRCGADFIEHQNIIAIPEELAGRMPVKIDE